MGSPWPRTWVAAGAQAPASIGGLAVTDLAARYGTPLFAVDLEELDARMAAWVGEAESAFAGLAGADVYYASKAFTCTAMVRRAHAAGLRLDVASGGELAVALAAGMDPALIGLHGNNKSRAEIEAALMAGVGRIVVDSHSEIAFLGEIAAERGVTAPVFLRVTTGVHAGDNEYVQTAHEDQKFGRSLGAGEALAAARAVVEHPHLDLAGLHMHIGSQILVPDGHAVSARALLALRAEIERQTGALVGEVDFGGGFGITYVDEDALTPGQALAAISSAVAEECRRLGTTPPRASFEPGRSIVGPAMVTLYEVGTVKTVTLDDGERTYVSLDASLGDNVLRPMLYGSRYVAAAASRELGGSPRRSRLVGKHCESGDILIKDLLLADDVRRGDLLAVPATGAYGRAMGSTYNLIGRPAVVAVADGHAEVWLRRETNEDLLALDPGA